MTFQSPINHALTSCFEPDCCSLLMYSGSDSNSFGLSFSFDGINTLSSCCLLPSNGLVNSSVMIFHPSGAGSMYLAFTQLWPGPPGLPVAVSYTHLRAHETDS